MAEIKYIKDMSGRIIGQQRGDWIMKDGKFVAKFDGKFTQTVDGKLVGRGDMRMLELGKRT
jgi:hypothetical protein